LIETNLGFEYRVTKDGSVFFTHNGKKAGALAGREAQKFIAKAEMMSYSDLQLVMAKATGHYKHGNERVGKKS
jgi:hypothetical protein